MKNKTIKRTDTIPVAFPKDKAHSSTVEETPFDLRRFLAACAVVSLVIFMCGYLLMIVAVIQIDYAGLVFAGVRSTDENGVEHFSPHYYRLSAYAVGANESLFSRTGALGTGLYFYSIVNALHWIVEMQYENIRMIVFLPLLVIFFGTYYLFYKFLPDRNRTNSRAALLGFGVGAFHAVFTIVFVLSGTFISSDFSAFYTSNHHYVGQLTGIMLPSMTILLLTGMTYGGIAGGVLAAVNGFHSTVKSMRP
ncbi:MAG: hypothetical protein AB1656_13960 [Candidatus Omnitrophota bacterium]